MSRIDRRFSRQIARLQRAMPRLGAMLAPGSRLRMPAALAMILGGMLGFLPVLGFWMLPLGLLLLAVDLPALRPVAGMVVIRFRQLGRRFRRRGAAGVRGRAGPGDNQAA